MRTSWLRSPSIRRHLLAAAVLIGCFVWAMVIMGLSFAMLEHGSEQVWVVPLFGVVVLAIAILAVRWVTAAITVPRPPAEVSPTPAVVSRTPAAVSRTPVEALSSRERQVLHHLSTGCTNGEIARQLFVAPGTVKAHLNHIFRKLEATNRLQAVAHAREAGLLD